MKCYEALSSFDSTARGKQMNDGFSVWQTKLHCSMTVDTPWIQCKQSQDATQETSNVLELSVNKVQGLWIDQNKTTSTKDVIFFIITNLII